MFRFVLRGIERTLQWLAAPALFFYFLDPRIGKHYNVGLIRKLELIWRFRANSRQIKTASDWREHLTMAAKILQIPHDTEGDVIECGCFKGGSTANLSLVCALAGRKLLVFDSFEGLPEPVEGDQIHQIHVTGRVIQYQQGQYAGRLDEVRENIKRYGAIDVCEFFPGYFNTTLPDLGRKIAFAYVDVDLCNSLEDCLIGIWPRLQENCFFFSHEAQVLNYIARFFDKVWWESQLNTPAPGFIGAGIGLPVVGIRRGSQLGYTRKASSSGVETGPRRGGILDF